MNFDSTLINIDSKIKQAIEVLDSSLFKIVLVVDAEKKLLGAITDGDVRRAILKGHQLTDSVGEIMSTKPIFVFEGASKAEINRLMSFHCIKQIPILNTDRKVIGIEVSPDILLVERKENFVVLMAGGLGSRLRPLTDDKPKPMLSVGDRPILETIITNFANQGFYKIFLSLNYRAEMIQSHFADGKHLGVEIEYLVEEEKLGTAGALSLLTQQTNLPILVMNADLLTRVSFPDLLASHQLHQAAATMCVREYELQVPFGVVSIDQEKILSIDEKPTHKFFVNAGIYVLNSDVISLIPKNKYLDMPTLFNQLIE
ncbi:MAG: nucleotidyltransferase family protein, partial [Bdellovibrionaceae bacterium]|nr:nucleotidyltransferase family protein [Pseudobdellovibrionaceae bacterium]